MANKDQDDLNIQKTKRQDGPWWINSWKELKRDRKTETERETEGDTETDRETKTESHTNRQRYTQRDPEK